MKLEVEINMYVRIIWGNGLQTISKCTNYVEIANNDFYIHTDVKGEVIYKSMILKASYDKLDLIEKDDVVAYYNKLQDIKGLIIERVQDNDYIKRLRKFVEIGTINIVRVMTKEQFEKYSYMIGE